MLKFVDLIQCIIAGQSIVVYHREAFQQREPSIYWGSVGGCYTELHSYFDCPVSLLNYKGELCIILEADPV